MPKPNAASTPSSSQYDGVTRISAQLTAIAMPPARLAARVPARAIHEAVVSIARIEPHATASSANDSMPGLSANLSRTVGTCTPHDA